MWWLAYSAITCSFTLVEIQPLFLGQHLTSRATAVVAGVSAVLALGRTFGKDLFGEPTALLRTQRQVHGPHQRACHACPGPGRSPNAAPKLLCALGGPAPLLRAVPALLHIRGERARARLTQCAVVLRSVRCMLQMGRRARGSGTRIRQASSFSRARWGSFRQQQGPQHQAAAATAMAVVACRRRRLQP